MSRGFLIPVVAILFALTSCRPRTEGPPAVAEAFAAPATLNIRKDLALESPVVATVKHGEAVEVIQSRRRFVQVRTAQGVMGWTDGRLLLSPEQMQDLKHFADNTSALPAQGVASVYEALNVHTEPSRTSPSFVQIPENGKVEVIGHRVAPKTSAAQSPPPLVTAPAKKARAAKKERDKEKEKARRISPPPMPAAPKLPENWNQLSRPTLQDVLLREQAADSSKSKSRGPGEPKPAIIEDWSLIRTKEGKVGWVLSRMLTMTIPDEVAQYAEGQRITSYFSLGDIRDEDQTKHVWLWTTMSHGGQPFEFDGFRVFVWSRKRHRYETVYRGREVKGFYPVSATKGSGEKGEGATFTLMLEEDGQVVRNTYAFNGYRVNLQRNATQQTSEVASAAGAVAPVRPDDPWYKRLGARIRSLFR